MDGIYEGGYFLSLNGYICPPCKFGVKHQSSTFMNSGRNTIGSVAGQTVGRENVKIDSLEWAILPQKEWTRILNILETSYILARFFEARANDFITIRIYPGDRISEPFRFDEKGRVLSWRNCKVNLIDRGELEVIRG